MSRISKAVIQFFTNATANSRKTAHRSVIGFPSSCLFADAHLPKHRTRRAIRISWPGQAAAGSNQALSEWPAQPPAIQLRARRLANGAGSARPALGLPGAWARQGPRVVKGKFA